MKLLLQGSQRSGKSGKILKTFSNQGKTGGFQPKSGRGGGGETVKPQELSGNCT